MAPRSINRYGKTYLMRKTTPGLTASIWNVEGPDEGQIVEIATNTFNDGIIRRIDRSEVNAEAVYYAVKGTHLPK